ncbi:MAG: sulfurtransferase TusA family protein [Gemmiger sp.]
MKLLDARGLSCPEPVIMIRKAMMAGGDGYQMVVDNVTARENVTRYAEHQGYTVTVEAADGEFTLTMKK